MVLSQKFGGPNKIRSFRTDTKIVANIGTFDLIIYLRDITISLPCNFDISTVQSVAWRCTNKQTKNKTSYRVQNNHVSTEQEKQSLLNSIYIERLSISTLFDPALPGYVFYCLKFPNNRFIFAIQKSIFATHRCLQVINWRKEISICWFLFKCVCYLCLSMELRNTQSVVKLDL